MEDGGLIDELTWAMLQTVARQRHEWAGRGVQLAISVNLSLKSLVDTEIADRITQIVRAEDVDPHAIILEVTESAAMTQVPQALENLARLRIRGFRLSIDDYGTGYSSMQQLTRVAFTELKIDQSFVMNALDDDACRVILDSSIEMARKLKIRSVAEGAETRGHWDLLQLLGCDTVQGYFIARPMAAAEVADWAAQWTPPRSAGSAFLRHCQGQICSAFRAREEVSPRVCFGATAAGCRCDQQWPLEFEKRKFD